MKILIVVAIVLMVGLFLYNERKRSDELGKIARQQGWTLNKGQQSIPAWLKERDFYLFSQGAPQILNLMQGQRGDYQVAVMGYFYDAPEGGEGRRETGVMDTDHQMENRGQTVVWLSRDGASSPDFDLAPRDSPKRLAAAHAGLQSVTFDGEDAFRKQFDLLGRDAIRLRQVFDRSVIEALMSRHQGLYMEGRGDQWLCYRHDDRLPPGQIMDFVTECSVMVDQLRTSRP